MTQYIRFPQSEPIDRKTWKLKREWQQWLQNPDFVSVRTSNAFGDAESEVIAQRSYAQPAQPILPSTADEIMRLRTFVVPVAAVQTHSADDVIRQRAFAQPAPQLPQDQGILMNQIFGG